MCVCMCHFAQGHMRKMCPNQLFPPEVVANIFKCLTVVRSLPLAFIGLSKNKQTKKTNNWFLLMFVVPSHLCISCIHASL